MNDTLLWCTLSLEVGLLAGYGLDWCHRFVQEGRDMVMAMLDAYLPVDPRP